MKTKRLAGVLLFIGLIGPLSTNAFAEDPINAGVGEKLQQASVLAQSGKYAAALKIIDQLRAMPNKTSGDNAAIRQMREYVVAQMQPH